MMAGYPICRGDLSDQPSPPQPVSLMLNRSTPLVPLVLFAVCWAASGEAMAQRSAAPASDRQSSAVPRGHARSEDQRALSAAVRRVESRTGGQVLSAERIPFDGRDVNRIKVVDASGRVRVYMDESPAARGRDEPQAPPSRTRDDDN